MVILISHDCTLIREFADLIIDLDPTRGGDRLVITRANCAGKSTLLSVLSGDLDVPAAQIERSEVRTGMLAQESGTADPQRRAAIRFGLLDQRSAALPLQQMPMGQRRRLDLAGILEGSPELLLLDEPSNHLSMRLLDQLTTTLRGTRATVVIITYDHQLLRDTADWHRLELTPIMPADGMNDRPAGGSPR